MYIIDNRGIAILQWYPVHMKKVISLRVDQIKVCLRYALVLLCIIKSMHNF